MISGKMLKWQFHSLYVLRDQFWHVVLIGCSNDDDYDDENFGCFFDQIKKSKKQ